MKRVLIIVFLVVLHCSRAFAQADFCDAVSAILRDAPDKFKNIKGKMLSSDFNVITWQTGVHVPGTIGSRFVASMGLFYEGAFFQSGTMAGFRAMYDRYKDELTACLAPQGYSVTAADNFSPGLSAYKKLVFMKEGGDDAKSASPPPHVTMEALYNKDIKKYTIVMYIFDN